MNPAAKKCIQWSIGLFVVGTLLLVYLPDIYQAIAGRAGANAEVGLEGLTIALTLVNSTVMPVGAALVGAAVVIQALAGAATRSVGETDRNRNRKA